MTQDALAARKHVYIEKPMTHRWEEDEAFIAAAEKSGKVVQVGSQYTSMGCAQKSTPLIKSGQLGQITLVEGRFHRNTATGAWYYPIPPDASLRHCRFQELPRLGPERRSSACGASSSGGPSGTIPTACRWTCRAPDHGDAPADGRAGAGERLQQSRVRRR